MKTYSSVPTTRIGRLFHYGSLAASITGGAITEGLRRAGGASADSQNVSVLLSPANMDKLVETFSRMRGAALKLGQILSIQDASFVPDALREVFTRMQDNAHFMPQRQLDQVMTQSFGSDWRQTKFATFFDEPIAAASIGQVHKATLPDGRKVAVKVQYPGVGDSISSDLSNLSFLLNFSSLLPRGLYLDKTIATARKELAWECDYNREAECLRRMSEYLADSKDFVVPQVFAEQSSGTVLTMEFMEGIPLSKLNSASQDVRNRVASLMLELCLREIVEWKFMQTDPNWANFLWTPNKQIALLDFGAARPYSPDFIDKYSELLRAACKCDKPKVEDLSIQLGYLTGLETPQMLQAHVQSVLTLAEPFRQDGLYDFAAQTITSRVREDIPLMLKLRLTPPPEETYSLHRKVSGIFLLCAQLQAQVPCKEIFDRVMNN